MRGEGVEDMKRKQEKGRGTEDGFPLQLSEKRERARETEERMKERKECPNFKGGTYLAPTLPKLVWGGGGG